MGWPAVSTPPNAGSALPPQALNPPNQDQIWHSTNFSSCVAGPTPPPPPSEATASRFEKKTRPKMNSVERAVARMIGQITLHQVSRHHTTKSAVQARMTRLRKGLSTSGRKPTLPHSIEQALCEKQKSAKNRSWAVNLRFGIGFTN